MTRLEEAAKGSLCFNIRETTKPITDNTIVKTMMNVIKLRRENQQADLEPESTLKPDCSNTSIRTKNKLFESNQCKTPLVIISDTAYL